MTIEQEDQRPDEVEESTEATEETAEAQANAADNTDDNVVDDIEGDELAAVEQKAADNWNLYLSAKAETDNVRKRSEKEVTNARLFALEKFVVELLPVKDSLEMGIKAAQESGESNSVAEGTELTLKMLEKALAKFGVEEVDVVDVKFNPEHHEAVTMIPSPGVESNSIVDVIQKGYLLNNRLVRPAMVVVAK